MEAVTKEQQADKETSRQLAGKIMRASRALGIPERIMVLIAWAIIEGVADGKTG